ncbi:Uridine nucleosidase 1 [Camellia lanceoleosa]|uniref:Uridine nucleosidase 1 n=1 Tax=Camellia lanceoleosa TaxID=1840588 RepID=A0ACC0IUH3_9ERIC|nr:Uridine nucleosidase 1 [Camellia lanceoleosa]
MKLICGTRIAGMNHKTRKEDKSILVPMMMKKLLLKDKQPLYWWFEWDDSHVTTFKIVPRGTEGAVSVERTDVGLLASILLSFVGYLMGEIANLGESVIGASLQEKEGFRWLTSDIDGPIRAGQGGRPRVADFVHGSDGLGNISLPPPKSKKIEKTSSEFLVDMVSKYPGEVSILALGPLTNFALAMKRDSSIASKVKRVVILGGSFFALGKVNPAPEANAWLL